MQSGPTARIQVPPTERIAPKDAPSDTTTRVASGGAPPVESPADKLFDQYTIYSRIGSGGMGVVYLARDRRLGRFVAIKRLNPQAQSIPSLRQRFLHEAQAVAVLSHVHIVHIYGLGEDEDGPFIVMEYIAGPDDATVRHEPSAGGLARPNPPLTLDQHITRHGQLTSEEAGEMLVKIARAVAYAHGSGVIHRDLKPSNILLDKSGEPKIVDFGLARLMKREESQLTAPGEKLLSLGYGAPEQETDASLSDERSDVYGLGGLLYFCITGQNPRYFREQDVPVPLREVVVKALATDKEQRWPSAAGFAEALHQVQARGRVETPTVKTIWRCKWCDAVNPLSVKYCAQCGWDGSEVCAECGAETFVGVQYCGNCGADARAYENVLQLLRKMRDSAAQQRFERVIACAGRVHGFEPAGPSGRRLLADLAGLREQAEQAIRRREQLRDQIPIEIRAENYERAALFIRQYRELSEDRLAFAAEEQQLGEQTLRRDLKLAWRAIKNREWEGAARLCRGLMNGALPDHPEIAQVRRAIRRHRFRMEACFTLGIALLIGAMYLGSLPPALRFGRGAPGRIPRMFYAPALWVYESGVVGRPLRGYARLWLNDDALRARFLPPPPPVMTEGDLIRSDALDELQRDYARQVTALEAEQETFMRAWPVEYTRELELLMERHRTAGDFEGWAVAQQERKRFEDTRRIENGSAAARSDLNVLKSKFRKMLDDQRLLHSRRVVTLGKKYINDLTDLQRGYMQDGKMDLATAVNAEIRRARGSQQYLAAEAVLAASGPGGGADLDTPSQMLLVGAGSENRVQEIANLRAEFDDGLSGVERAAIQQTAEWPERYVAGLVELMEQFQRAGDFSGWGSVRDEISRFEAERTIQPRNIVLQPSELMELQRTFYLRREEMRRSRAEGIVAVTEAYVRKLQDLQRRLTVEGQMETAAIVNAEIRRVRTRVDYIEAQNEILPQGPPVPPTLAPVGGAAAGAGMQP